MAIPAIVPNIPQNLYFGLSSLKRPQFCIYFEFRPTEKVFPSIPERHWWIKSNILIFLRKLFHTKNLKKFILCNLNHLNFIFFMHCKSCIFYMLALNSEKKRVCIYEWSGTKRLSLSNAKRHQYNKY